MAMAAVASSLHPSRHLFTPRLLSSLFSRSPSSFTDCVQVWCACSDPVPHHLSLNIDRRNFSVHFVVSAAALLLLQLTGCVELARAGVIKSDDNAVETNVLKRIEAFVDPREVTQTGRTLPRGYVQSAREVVRTLREALKDDVQEELKYRVISEPAKEAIRVYLSSWMSSKELATEDSFQALSKTLRDLGQFYLDAGPMASLPGDVKATLLEDLDKADAAL